MAKSVARCPEVSAETVDLPAQIPLSRVLLARAMAALIAFRSPHEVLRCAGVGPSVVLPDPVAAELVWATLEDRDPEIHSAHEARACELLDTGSLWLDSIVAHGHEAARLFALHIVTLALAAAACEALLHLCAWAVERLRAGDDAAWVGCVLRERLAYISEVSDAA